MEKIKVAFVCVHNSCRSQIAEALTKLLYDDLFEAYSGGTHPAGQINQDAVRIMKILYGIDMEEELSPKSLDCLPKMDIVITMGCNVDCPNIPCTFREDWGLDDPSGQLDEVFISVITTIEEKISTLKDRIIAKEIRL